MPGGRVLVICGCCGGDNILRDAWASWDAGAQRWEVASIHDAGFCHDCDTEVVTHERPERADA
jgi:hypothetical protein